MKAFNRKNLEVIKNTLINKGISFEVVRFSDKAVAARKVDSSVDKNYNPKEAIKTLVVKNKSGKAGVIICGEDKIDDKRLEQIMGKWTVVRPEVLLEEFGFEPGTVCPLVLDLPIYVDKKTLSLSKWSMGAGEVDKGINISKEEVLKNLEKVEIVSIVKENDNIKVMDTKLTTEEKIKLISRNCQEILTKEDLEALIESGTPLSHYIGFEISGLVHLGTGLISMGKIADFLNAGAKVRIFLADFHSYLNNKLGGDWENIRWATERYFKQGLIASLKCFGVEPDQVEFIMGKDLYTNNIVHWETFMEVGKHVTLSRNLRSISIMGKKQGSEVDMATLFYPPLQVSDIFTMGVNLAHAGIDQRKAHVIARQVAGKLRINPLRNNKGEVIAPIAIHQNLIAGLSGPENIDMKQPGDDVEVELKMSKSKPGSAIFIHDSPEEIRNKVRKAYGPPKDITFNPLINWVQTLVFWGEEEGEFTIERPEKFGGNVTYTRVSDLIEDYKSEKLYPLDLKNALADWLIKKLEPARAHFEIPENKEALEKMKELLGVK